jgi:hypothetical protein
MSYQLTKEVQIYGVHAIAEAVQRPSTRCIAVKTDTSLIYCTARVRSRLVGQRTAVINQIRGFLLEHGIAVRQGLRFLRQQLPDILAKRSDVLSPRTPSSQTMLLCLGPPRSWRRSEDADLWWGSPLPLSGLRRHLVTPAASSYSQFLSYTAQPRPFPGHGHQSTNSEQQCGGIHGASPGCSRNRVCGYPPLT